MFYLDIRQGRRRGTTHMPRRQGLILRYAGHLLLKCTLEQEVSAKAQSDRIGMIDLGKRPQSIEYSSNPL